MVKNEDFDLIFVLISKYQNGWVKVLETLKKKSNLKFQW
jgi:hypothetical protein